MTCVSCRADLEIIYRGMCQTCTRDFRYARYRGWIERKALRLGRRIPGEGRRRFVKERLKRVSS
jgi:hypothetical protein